jgi:hypothetical protein
MPLDTKFKLIIEIDSADKESMIESLKRILIEFNSNYGKPCQGTSCQYYCKTYIKTPIWDGKDF